MQFCQEGFFIGFWIFKGQLEGKSMFVSLTPRCIDRAYPACIDNL